MVIRDTQSSRKIDINGHRGIVFLTFGFKDAQNRELLPQVPSPLFSVLLPLALVELRYSSKQELTFQICACYHCDSER
jgi:hypothetical protein